MRRVYCNGSLTKETLAAELDEGFVCVDVVWKGQGGRNDVAYFREGTPEEIAHARALLARAQGLEPRERDEHPFNGDTR